MDANVKFNLGASVLSVNEKGEPEFGSMEAQQLSISNETFERMVFESQSFNELYENLRESGVYLAMEDSKTVVMPVSRGTVVFFNDGPTQEKLVLDKELTPDVVEQIQRAQDRDDLEEILVQNNVIERPEHEVEREVTVDDRLTDVDRADNVGEHDMANNGAIGENRYARYNDPERRQQRGMDR